MAVVDSTRPATVKYSPWLLLVEIAEHWNDEVPGRDTDYFLSHLLKAYHFGGFKNQMFWDGEVLDDHMDFSNWRRVTQWGVDPEELATPSAYRKPEDVAEVYLKGFAVSHRDFLEWCGATNETPPAFWMGPGDPPTAELNKDKQKLDGKGLGRPRGSGSFYENDRPFLVQMDMDISRSPGIGISTVARKYVSDAVGGGTEESKVKRLVRNYGKFKTAQKD